MTSRESLAKQWRYAQDADDRARVRANKRQGYAAHREKIDAWRWRGPAENPAHRAKQRSYCPEKHRDAKLRYFYGMSLRDYDLMLARQLGVCAVCGEQPARRLCVDHCHVTGKVRGLLCSPCNLAIGQLKDSPARLRKAAAYVEAALDASLDGEYAYRARPGPVAPPRKRWRRAAALRAKLIDPKLFDPLPQAGDQLLAVGEMPLLHVENAREAALLERQHVDRRT